MKEFTVKEDTTLKAFTDAVCPQASMCLRTLLRARDVRVNGEKVGADLPLRRGDKVAYYMNAAQEGRASHAVVYADENVLVVDKESGVNAEALYAELSAREECYFIHRLDRNTEGLMIFARTREAERELVACFRERRTEKIYRALVFGTPKAHAVETAFLVKDEKNARVFVSARGAGEKIVTEYSLLEQRGETALVEVVLHTGKTHQIRAHLAFLGLPVVGDEKYGDHAANRRLHAARQRLLAAKLTLHPHGTLAYLDGKVFASEKTL